MQYCPLCQVKVVGSKRCCPLCRGKLTGEPDPQSEVFPQVVAPYRRARVARRIITLCVLIVIACSIQVETIWHPSSNWPYLVIAASLCAWLAVMLGISRRRLLMQNLTAQALLFSILSVAWDIGTGWHAWSIEWVIPILLLGGVGVLLLLKLILRVPMVDAVGWIGVLSILGWIAPIVLMLLDKVQVKLPSMICSGGSFLTLVILVVFFHRYMRDEAARRFHL